MTRFDNTCMASIADFDSDSEVLLNVNALKTLPHKILSYWYLLSFIDNVTNVTLNL